MGKVFRRISDGTILGNEIYLGLYFPPEGEPYLELPEHFEEIEEPITEETQVMNENLPLIATQKEIASMEEETGEPLTEEIKRVTIKDYLDLKNNVEQLMKMVYGNIK